MKRRQRAVLTAVAIGLSAGASFVACSGSESDGDLFDAGSDAAGDATTTDVSAADTSTQQDTSPPIDAPVDTGPPFDAGMPIVLDAGGYEGGLPCVAGGTPEMEPNDTSGMATPFTSRACGAILPMGDKDFFTFKLANTTTTFDLRYLGDVKLVVTVKGQTVTLGPGMSPAIPFFLNEDYIVEVQPVNPATPRVNYIVALDQM